MAELLQLPELPVNGTTTTTIVTTTDPPSQHGLTSSKRQRRPSVRLGDIGDQPYDSYRRNKLWNDSRYRFYSYNKDTGILNNKSSSSSRTRPLTNLGSNGHETLETLENLEPLQGGRDLKGKRGVSSTKRVRSNWVSSSKIDEGYEKFSSDEWYRDLSESPLKEQHHQQQQSSPIHSPENHITGGQMDGRSDTDVREWNCRTSVDTNGVRIGGLEDGVRMWLNGLGLGRYEPVFEINEVDEEVLPLLTLEDLKDMGINAVGSRRKLYCAIQKLGRGFS